MGKLSVHSTGISGVSYVISCRHADNRGSFSRWFCMQELAASLPGQNIVQINHSFSLKSGTVRGLHFQHPPYAEYKLVRCIAGSVFDVVVDLRCESPTFLQHVSYELSAENNAMLIIPPGCAHGFQTLTDNTALLYLHTAYYQPEAEDGIRADDARLKIRWPLPISCMSERDQNFMPLALNYPGLKL